MGIVGTDYKRGPCIATAIVAWGHIIRSRVVMIMIERIDFGGRTGTWPEGCSVAVWLELLGGDGRLLAAT